MHLADGIVSNAPLLVGLDLVGAAGVSVAVTRSVARDARRVAWTGTLAAFVLAAQAINVPMVPGASAHVIGAGLLALALGPSEAIVAMTAVLLVQALLFGDGGITTLGLNVLDMAVLPVLVVHGLRRLLGESKRALTWTAFTGTLVGTMAGAAVLSTTLVFGAGAPARMTFAWIVGVQGIAGLIEGVLAAIAVRHLMGRAPGLLARRAEAPLDRTATRESQRGLVWAAVAIAVALVLLPLASTQPDALEVVVQHLRLAVR